jgi:hypothetical protein
MNKTAVNANPENSVNQRNFNALMGSSVFHNRSNAMDLMIVVMVATRLDAFNQPLFNHPTLIAKFEK